MGRQSNAKWRRRVRRFLVASSNARRGTVLARLEGEHAARMLALFKRHRKFWSTVVDGLQMRRAHDAK